MAAAGASSSSSQGRHDGVFASVFPRANLTTPTPEATPNIGVLASPGGPFGGFGQDSFPTDDTIKFNRAWSLVTRFLALQSNSQAVQEDEGPDHAFYEAFVYVCSTADGRHALIAWYANEISVIFRDVVQPQLHQWQQPIPVKAASEVLFATIDILQRAQTRCLNIIDVSAKAAPSRDAQAMLQSFETDARAKLRTQVLHFLPKQRLLKTLTFVFYQHMKASLQSNANSEVCRKVGECQCSLSLEGLPLPQLRAVGLGGDLGERAFAQAVHRLLVGPTIQLRCFGVNWARQSSIVGILRRWVLGHVCDIVEEALIALTGNAALNLSDRDRGLFAQIAVANLGRQRSLSLFDYIKSWPDSAGAILDIRDHIMPSASEKALVCSDFTAQVEQRLLHSGASTTEILSIYANVIHAFRLLDARGVMLEKVATPIRSYLRSRDDTVSIIAASFLAEVGPDGEMTNGDSEKVCADITLEVANSTTDVTKDPKHLNWNDMEWVPDPIDAGPNYKASKSEDVLAYILGLFDQDEFVKEVTSVLAQHLLHATDPEYIKETRLIELFKSRLDASKLQAAEVMLKDMRDSVKLNKVINPQSKYTEDDVPTPREVQMAIPDEGITMPSLFKMFERRMKQSQFQAVLNVVATRRNDLYFPKRTRLPPGSGAESADRPNWKAKHFNYTAQVLSSFFWPQMRSNTFRLPPNGFEERDYMFDFMFVRLGNQRKLQYHPALGRVDVNLELEDRLIREVDVPAWRASVIDAFASEREKPGYIEYDPEAGLTAEQLSEALRMEGELVTDALNYWTSKRVLYQKEPGTYAVLERLDIDTGPVQQPMPSLPDNISAVKSQDALLQESAAMFEQFIANMLRNGGPKEIGGMMGITNMMKMVLPMFTYGDEEVTWLLGEMEGKGEVVRNGETWAIAG